MTADDVVAELDAIDCTNDPERAHGEADHLLLMFVGPDVAAAYDRLVKRCPWWATA